MNEMAVLKSETLAVKKELKSVTKVILLHVKNQNVPVELPEKVKVPLQSREEVDSLEELLKEDGQIKNALVRFFSFPL